MQQCKIHNIQYPSKKCQANEKAGKYPQLQGKIPINRKDGNYRPGEMSRQGC